MSLKQKPGPLCQTRGHGPIDTGTLCRQQSSPPAPVGMFSRVAYWTRQEFASFGFPKDAKGNALNWTSHYAESLLLSILDLIPFKPDSPQSTAMLKHYVESSGELYEIKDVPKEWQEWIVKATDGKLGLHKSLSPYNSGIYDLRNSLGHFDVIVTRNSDGTKTYTISDTYGFGYLKHDRNQTGRHGFPLGELSPTTLHIVRMLLPSQEYVNPGGFKEHWEIKQVGKETLLLIPQQFLAEQGKPFPVKGVFKR